MSAATPTLVAIRHFVAALVVAAVIGMPGAATAQLYATPVTDPDKLYRLEGFTLTPPRGEAWFEMKRDEREVYFGKRLPSPTHSFIAVAVILTVTAEVDSAEAWRDYVVRQMTNTTADPRNRILLMAADVDPAAGPLCVRYQMRVEDQGAAYARGRTLLVETTGLNCLHPGRRNLAIDMSFTERGLPDQFGSALRGEGERFLASLKILPQP